MCVEKLAMCASSVMTDGFHTNAVSLTRTCTDSYGDVKRSRNIVRNLYHPSMESGKPYAVMPGAFSKEGPFQCERTADMICASCQCAATLSGVSLAVTAEIMRCAVSWLQCM